MMPPLGLESGAVRVVGYDPRWPTLFEAEVERLSGAIAPPVLHLEHVGSTAVPGLAAKPVLDILAGYREPASEQRYIAALGAAGYEDRGEQGIPGRQFFRRGQPRAYHVHLTLVGSAFWHDHLDFRTLLRSNPERRAEYARLKQELAARHPRDREAYIDGKSAFVLAALREWRAGGEA